MTSSSPRGRLDGARILLTGLRRDDDPLADRLRALGAAVDRRPAIEVRPLEGSADRVRRALERLPPDGWLVLTSASAVEALEAAGVGSALQLAGPRVACVGAATAAAYRRLSGREPECVGAGRGVASLAAEMRSSLAPRARLVWCRAERVAGDPRVAFAPAEVEHVVVYRTSAHADAAAIADDLRAGRYDLVVFSSPSGVEALVEASLAAGVARCDALGDPAVVAIGSTTHEALRRSGAGGARVELAASAGTAGLLDAALRARAGAAGLRDTIPDRPRHGASERSVSGETSELRRTPLHEAHERAGAKLVDFAGWQMPVQYSGVIDEHLAVRRTAGLFDVSHMGEARVRGAGALEFLQHVTCNDVAKLVPGRAHYTGLTTPQGTFVDDLLIYMLDEADYLLVLNAANTPKDVDWLARHASGFEVELADVSAAWAQIAIQGPRAAGIVDSLRDGEPRRIRYYRFRQELVAGARCILSRTGYTGEDGFELYCAPDDAPGLWARLLEAGADDGLVPVGLAARDTLRLEAKMALYGNDIDETTTVLEADLGWICKLDKGEFVGRDALLAQRDRGIERKLVGFELRDRGIARQGGTALHDGRQVGRVTSGSHAPFLEKSIGLVYLPLALCEPGTTFEIDVRGRRLAAEVVQTPFYKRDR